MSCYVNNSTARKSAFIVLSITRITRRTTSSDQTHHQVTFGKICAKLKISFLTYILDTRVAYANNYVFPLYNSIHVFYVIYVPVKID